MNLKLVFVAASALFILNSCGGESENTEKKQTIDELYAEFKKSDDYKVSLEFDKKLNRAVDLVTKTAVLPAKPEELSGVRLDFEKKVLTGIYFSPFYRGEKVELNWDKQDNYTRFIKTLNEGVGAYKIKGVTDLASSWDYTQKEMVNYIKNGDYYAALIVKNFTMPDAETDRNYVMGTFSGKLVIIDLKTEKAVGSVDIIATSSESLMFNEGNIVPAIREDLFKNINEEILSQLDKYCADVHYKERFAPKLKKVD